MDKSLQGLLWKKGDWAAYFGLLANNLTNLLTMIALLLFVVGFPEEIVYGRVVPAFGLGIFLASICYFVFGYFLAKTTGRKDVTALPSGPSAPSIFTVTFLVILPVYLSTKNAEFAFQIALVWCFFEAMILVVGSFLGDTIRRMIPRTVLLSCLSGLGLLLLAMNPMLQSFETPVVAFAVLIIIFLNWFGKKPILAKIPTGFLLLATGTILAWAFGLQDPAAIAASMQSFGFNPPTVHVDSLIQGIPHALPYLASAVPLGLANYIFDLENIESAHAAGDEYKTRQVMLANGLSSIIGCFCGNPYPVTVYVGHAGWKSLGAGIGYTVATGLSMFIISLFGIGAFLLAVIPVAAIVPILVYIGIVTANQVVRETPKLEVPVIFICMFPWIANWALTLTNNVLSAAGTTGAKVGVDVMANKGVYYNGLMHLGNGAPISSMVWGCIAIFAITDKPLRGAIAGAAGAALSLFGIIHSPTVGFALDSSMQFVYSYLMVAAIFVGKYMLDKNAPLAKLQEKDAKA
ncbi:MULTISPECIES: xanthine permease [Brevibacillus]|uniref:xanthine permease n=1 Tax=Brevibacillus TaxID=55080 RepID=UPI0023801939|nr:MULTISPECIES: xanthine permease [Brevibacillus]MDH6353179.1 AGZA family xanthine/uracil permease-like MFS transporter [Brevibacillus sp. 1238]WDV94120.1 xanthine permease [Brevibacillus parabrevis]